MRLLLSALVAVGFVGMAFAQPRSVTPIPIPKFNPLIGAGGVGGVRSFTPDATPRRKAPVNSATLPVGGLRNSSTLQLAGDLVAETPTIEALGNGRFKVSGRVRNGGASPVSGRISIDVVQNIRLDARDRDLKDDLRLRCSFDVNLAPGQSFSFEREFTQGSTFGRLIATLRVNTRDAIASNNVASATLSLGP